MDPDPGGPKTCGSGFGSGSATLLKIKNLSKFFSGQVSVEELKSLLGKYSNTESLAQSGVTVAAKKYMFLSSTDRVVRARKGTSGLHCIKTVQGRPPLFFYIMATYLSSHVGLPVPYSCTVDFRYICIYYNRSYDNFCLELVR
jgi:hypothetical protein